MLRRVVVAPALMRRQCHQSSTLGNDDGVKTDFVNRNPRSMELLRLARKPQGKDLDGPLINFWYKLNLQQTGRHIEGSVMHCSGRSVVSASTREWSIRKHLYSCTDYNAVINIGRILTRRCLQAGISEMSTELASLQETSDKVKGFLTAVQEGGIVLEEPFQIHETDTYMWSRKVPVFPWQVPENEVLTDSAVKKPSR